LRQLNGIRAVLFDLDGTLRHNKPSASHAFLDYAVQLGLPDSLLKRKANLRWVHYYWAQSPELFADLAAYDDELSEAFWIQYADRSLEAFGAAPAEAERLAPEVQRMMREQYDPISENWIPEDVPPTLGFLRQTGYCLGLVSNRSTPFTAELEKMGLVGYFDFTLAAGEVNAWKPGPEIFGYALERCGYKPEQAVYVGDNYYADILGAQNAGLLPVLIDPDQLFPEAACPVISTIGDLLALLTPQEP
jgi:putative hydrolase of the HAD superfamily